PPYPRPPTSSLFPYTTLFRSRSVVHVRRHEAFRRHVAAGDHAGELRRRLAPQAEMDVEHGGLLREPARQIELRRQIDQLVVGVRSEERRVGKEWTTEGAETRS